MKFLDCFCGLGGASEGFHREGFDCTGIDIVNVGYPYKFILADMTELDGKDFQGYDVIWGSPPCRDFTIMCDHGLRKNGTYIQWKKPKNPKEGLKLVHAYLRFIEEAQPTYWIMENVPKLAEYYELAKQTSYLHPGKRRSFWGNYPAFLMPLQTNCVPHQEAPDRWKYVGKKVMASWHRAKIPLACSLAFARACKQELLK